MRTLTRVVVDKKITCIHVEIGNVFLVYNYLLKSNKMIWPSALLRYLTSKMSWNQYFLVL